RELQGVTFNGELRLLARRGDGTGMLLDALGEPAPLDEAAVRAAFAAADVSVASLELLATEDAYYYGHKQPVPLPVWRAVLGDAQQSRVYVNPTDASIRIVDAPRRTARWITQGFHSLDFSGLRWRPVWDIVV